VGRTDLRLAELVEQSWIVPPTGSILRDRLTALFLSEGLDPPMETVETLAVPLVVSLLTNTDMVVALPRELVQGQIAAGELVALPFDLKLRMDVYGIITRQGHVLSPGAEILVDALREAAAAELAASRRARPTR